MDEKAAGHAMRVLVKSLVFTVIVPGAVPRRAPGPPSSAPGD